MDRDRDIVLVSFVINTIWCEILFSSLHYLSRCSLFSEVAAEAEEGDKRPN
jgi:hypothetical protein